MVSESSSLYWPPSRDNHLLLHSLHTKVSSEITRCNSVQGSTWIILMDCVVHSNIPPRFIFFTKYVSILPGNTKTITRVSIGKTGAMKSKSWIIFVFLFFC